MISIANNLNTEHLFFNADKKNSRDKVFNTTSSFISNNKLANQQAAINIIPGNVQIFSKTASYNKLNSSIVAQIAKGVNINSNIQTSLSEVASIIDDLIILAEYAKNSTFSNIDRLEFNNSAKELLNKIDNYYASVESNEFHILQGDTISFATGSSNETYTMNLGNVNRTFLKINSINLDSVNNATDAYSFLNSAKNIIDGQIKNIVSEGRSLSALSSVKEQYIDILSNSVKNDISKSLSVELFYMTKEAIFLDVSQFSNVQGKNLSSSVILEMLNSLQNLSQAMNKVADEDEKNEAKTNSN